MIAFESVPVGTALPSLNLTVDRAQLVRYAGASGDFNPIHFNQRIAEAVGLPNVIAHGMLTMALSARIVTGWIGDPSAVRDLSVRFTRPVIVPDDDHGAALEISAVVGAVDAQARTARVDITAKFEGQTVLGKARCVVQLS
ncbi:dehydratase [Nakamurella antarctica]|uniref:Dehydratase n=2 Tax=Nakamurella antarctica TaxID=1902245 RepID=A0A3G8ZN25_9ACTN|nr:dehydratase [Nakamurella antarctica]